MAYTIARNGAPTQPVLQSTTQQALPPLQPSRSPPRPRRKRLYGPSNHGAFSTLFLYLFALTAILPLASAVFINFENCLDRTYRNERNPVRLQFRPMHLWATFNTTSPRHGINVTVYGNVTGQAYQTPLPPAPPDDQGYWSDPKKTDGKITDVGNGNLLSTLFATFKVLTYTAYNQAPLPFCNNTVNSRCPMGPSFEGNASDPTTLSGWTVGHDFYSTYSFATFAFTTKVVSGDTIPLTLACVSANITPALGNTLADALCYLPAAVLALVAIATIFAATCSPWGTSNIFRWTSNYGRDEDLLRLVTPGFGDCLQYIQFVVLAGSLNLQYPGFFQPVVSQASWSVLLFNESLVSHGSGSQSLVDGIYFANGTYGISRLGQYVGMSEDKDIWAGMAVWLLGLIAIVVVLIQLGFLGRWGYRALTNTQDGDLRGRNWPFTAGNIVRIVFNFFMLPIVSLSLFQLVVARHSPASVVGTSVILLIGVLGFATWIFWLIFTTRPRAHLFDDLPTVLTYGPLYNTYSDDAAPFAFIPVLLTIIRGIAIGAIQPSGIAQIIVLAICEVILILTLHAFRPFQSNTSMNAYHTFFSAIRLVCVLLMVAFVPSLGVAEASKGWIGYAILLLHAIVLVFGFFLNSLQTLIEVAARLAGAGQDQRGGLASVFGKRQLSRRNHRQQRSSLNSDAAMLSHDENKQAIQLMNGRSRSMSGSSAVLLNGPYGTGSQRASVGFDQFSQGGDPNGGTSPGTPGTNVTPWSYLGGGSAQSSRRPTMGGPLEASDPYYRQPRARKATMESIAPGQSGRGPSTDLDQTPYADNAEQAEAGDSGEGPSSWSHRGSITPAYLKMHRDDSDPALAERRKNTDYSVRESDLYYGHRGPALSNQPTPRKLKTGPADPMSPVSSATGWFKSLNLFGGPKKEKGKGFEVVRSTRMPPQMMPLEEDDESPPIPHEPYHDSPANSPKKSLKQVSPAAALGAIGRRPSDSDSSKSSSDESYEQSVRVANTAPTLGPIETGGGIELPSRIGSRASRNTGGPSRAPTLPRKSSRRTGSTDRAVLEGGPRLSTVMASPPATPGRMSAHISSNTGSQHLHPHSNTNAIPIRLPFGSSSDPSPSPERSPAQSAASSVYRNDADLNQLGPTEDLVPPQMIQAGTERPLSTGYVHHHMAGDRIHNEGYDAGSHLEASAEFVDRSRSLSTQHSSRSGRGRR
ncbi:integral membrane protein [Dendryphion nanum]|uniref:Integral membrane protein n=1 Tax=Dendryphion nanum TaxID=256645 RepID=A0A9P9IG90_9PLEO|nr:integral membrane protein [Dendryphion nanum]